VDLAGVHAHGAHPHEHLTSPGDRDRDLLEAEHVGRAGAVVTSGEHGMTSRWDTYGEAVNVEGDGPRERPAWAMWEDLA
jgi:hypothetical protein